VATADREAPEREGLSLPHVTPWDLAKWITVVTYGFVCVLFVIAAVLTLFAIY
jgi:uncharacterized membrane protein